MSNTSHLIANDVPGGAAGDVGWDAGRGEAVAEGPNAVPVFWLALFGEMDLVGVEVETEDGGTLTVPSLVSDLGEALRRLRDRGGLLAARFPEFATTWDEFVAALAGLGARFVKLDVFELWDLAAAVDEDFEAALGAALQWFESRDEDDFARLLEIASIRGYDMRRRSFQAVGEGVPRAFHLRGYASDPASWDDEADI